MATRPRPRAANLEHRVLLAGSAVLLAAAVAGIGSPRNWWSRKLELSFLTTNAAGLRLGMPVTISGYPVGRVTHIRLLSNAQVKVSLLVRAEQQALIGPSSRATLTQDNLIGNPYIAITPDLNNQDQLRQPQPQTTLIYEPSPGLASLFRELAATRIPLQQMLTQAGRLMERRMPQSMDRLDATLNSGQRLADTVERALHGSTGQLEQRVNAAGTRLEHTLETLQSTLEEIQGLARSSQALLQNLNRSWLMRLLEPAAAPETGAPTGSAQLRNNRE